jgi:hypothetical protein
VSTYSWRRRWVEDKRAIAERISRGEAGGGYPEAVILICAALSALSAELWPGRGIDKSRFVELLVRLGPHSAYCKTISVPLLVQFLADSKRTTEAGTLGRELGFPHFSRVLTGPEIDASEDEILRSCPSLEIKDLRRCSYASVLYQEIRSSYAHEYQPGENAESWPMTMKPDQRVSYINRLVDAEKLKVQRLIHFHVEWLGELATGLAASVDAEEAVPRPLPVQWWSEGAT